MIDSKTFLQHIPNVYLVKIKVYLYHAIPRASISHPLFLYPKQEKAEFILSEKEIN